MSIAIVAPTRDCTGWITKLKELDEKIEIFIYPDIPEPEKVTCAVVWLYPHGVLKKFPNLKMICSMGAGVDHILKDPELPKLPVTRVVSERLAFSMKTYAIMAVLNYHRRMDKYLSDQLNKIWDQDTFPEIPVKIGVFGFGYLGQEIGKGLKQLGFEVHGFSNRMKKVEGIITYGKESMEGFLKNINILIGVLPMTKKTKGIFNKEFFKKLPNPTFFINIGRGNQQNEQDIIEALDQNLLTGVMLDVFESEPLSKESKLWNHPKVRLTPHIAGITNPDAAIPQIFENYKRMNNGNELLNAVDLDKGY